ncbi:MAG TPA: DEAD/DEAH box helicase [Rhodothermales bacterium]|nr:DEAD/DEAH box helicase [Rhodothermales bacterium]
MPSSDIVNTARDKHPKINFTDDFTRALSAMDGSHGVLFITGEAGTGKSTLLQCFKASTKKKIAVVAPTGVAAINVGGQTIHSFFKFPPAPISTIEIKRAKNSKMYRALDALVIDEVSMVRADLMDGIDRFLRVNGRDARVPFGGIPLILIGDLFQLPPVVQQGPEMEYLRREYASPYFFSARAFRSTGIKMLRLDNVFRQKDDEFIRLLNAIRTRTVSRADMDRLNQRFLPQFQPPEDQAWITLTATNRVADAINRREIGRLKTKQYLFEGETTGRFARLNEHNLPAPPGLALKEGAQVMFLRNDPFGRWVNGTMGRVKRLKDDIIEVEVGGPGGQVEKVERGSWEMYEYVFDARNNRLEAEVAGTYEQYPLRPAYAITIHKSQGKTFERVIVDLGGGAFAHGQTYVALSRLVRLDGLVLRRPLSQRDLILDPEVADFAGKSESRNQKAEWTRGRSPLSDDDLEGLRDTSVGRRPNLG